MASKGKGNKLSKSDSNLKRDLVVPFKCNLDIKLHYEITSMISIQLLSYCTFQEIVIWAVREGMPISNFQRENCQLLNELKPNLIKSHFLQKLTRSAAIEKDSVIWNWIGILFLLSNILSALMRVIKKAAVGGSVGIIRHKPAFY